VEKPHQSNIPSGRHIFLPKPNDKCKIEERRREGILAFFVFVLSIIPFSATGVLAALSDGIFGFFFPALP